MSISVNLRQKVLIWLLVSTVVMAAAAAGGTVVALAASTPTQAPGADLQLTAKAAVLMDYVTGEVLFEKNAHTPLPPASVTKIMTLALALEALAEGRVQPDTLVTASELAASMGGTQIWLEPNEQMRFEDLLFAIAVGSANDASVAVAEHLAGSVPAFVQMMNQKARSLGMENTTFSNPSGLPPAELGETAPHLASAYDLALLSRWALKLPRFRELVSTWGPVVMRPETKRQPELWTYNKMMKQYAGMDGIKTGMTNEAGFCLAATAERANLRLIAVVLGAPSSTERNKDVAKLLDYGFARRQALKIAGQGEVLGQVEVAKGKKGTVQVAPARDVIITGTRESKLAPETQIIPKQKLTAPIKKGQAVAELVVLVSGEEVARFDLLAAEDVDRGSVWQLMLSTVRGVFNP
ncbi:MAG TPA: D-alanyl-D-alanine carboxypeptidase [Firmicutes bacterium]|nr:D-alanyl-D-alanine carboxypeptidase [Bacillota bacterium]